MPRIWRTNDGRHVPDGHPDAAVLAFGPGDAVPAAVLAEVEGDDADEKPKRARRPADKAKVTPAEDKSADDDPEPDEPKGGLTIKRQRGDTS